ncbi:hypothetical protein [Mucilaginibacter myungsuensis]|uniref:Uncharacterized protein n=1 Tax=Mucilaginibacter myungsuensis TaxID=649104 RepID=A0A929PYL6_9SPHI|nr:hypothetical protein [Mucilaginibacter myungsuensis]MBE9664294.1 hypothetical protein [Mucilaginibacter myungsuensis]MDN3599998.1 hypothetical protein [Mucilaginibacter myungsuensis]
MMSLIRKITLSVIAIGVMLIFAYAQKKFRDKEIITGYIKGDIMDETSGIAASTLNNGVFYIHNDSGDTSRFFAISTDGTLKATYNFNPEPHSGSPYGVRDMEDIAVGPGPEKDKNYVYLGDIGDNAASHKYITIYRIEEPKLDVEEPTKRLTAEQLYLKYPDKPKDAETMMVDPVGQLIYIVSKRNNSVIVYTTPLNYKTGDTVTLDKRTTLHFGGIPPFKWITGGSISKDGSQILLRNYNRVFYWKRTGDMPIWETMTQKPLKLYYKKEKQGEAIGFTNDGKGYYTASEGLDQPIYYYKVP